MTAIAAPEVVVDHDDPVLDRPAQPTTGPQARRSWAGTPAQNRAVVRTLAATAMVAAALPFSHMYRMRDNQYGATLGELALVPLCAFGLALAAAYRHPWITQLRAGRADYAVAAGAFALAVLLLAWGPVAAGNHYFALRPDLLALPLVAVAAVCLVFGVRALVAFVVPLGVLALAWPLPMRALLEPVVGVVTTATSWSVRALLEVAPLATVVPVDGDLRLHIPNADGGFDVLVASACSGVAGILGMLMIGGCAQYVLHGRLRARVLWLATAVALAWVLNLARIFGLLALGRTAGEVVAMEVVHPVAGLLLLNVAMAVHVLLARRFGLTFALQRRVPMDTPLTAPAPAALQARRPQRSRRMVALVSVVVALATLGSTVPWTSDAFAGTAPSASPFAQSPDAGDEHELVEAVEKPWAEQYFGQDSVWTRYRFAPGAHSSLPTLWVDSVLTEDWSGLRAHPLLDCYTFHDFELVSVDRPTLEGDMLADQVVYRRPDGATWHVLSWEWPVQTADGTMAHERVTLLASSARTDIDPGTSTGRGASDGGLRGALARRLSQAASGTDPNPNLTAALRGVADEVIDTRLAAGPGVLNGGAA